MSSRGKFNYNTDVKIVQEQKRIADFRGLGDYADYPAQPRRRFVLCATCAPQVASVVRLLSSRRHHP